MSQPAVNYRGRYPEPVPTSNLVHEAEDVPAFEAFEGAEVTPRGQTPESVSVVHVDMCQQMNKRSHFTSAYDTPNLVVRRGQEFLIRVTFSRPLGPNDDFQLEFRIGSNPMANRGSLVVVAFGGHGGGKWTGRVLDTQDASMTLGITSTANAIVGKFRTHVAIVSGNGLQRTQRDATTDLYMLCNAWCAEDAVYYPDEAGRHEYVLNDYGVIYQGSVDAVTKRHWMFGQFERGVLDACISILDASRMPISSRGDAIKLVRKGSAMINSQDDNGVLVGNWSDDYSGGSAPTLWTGSVKILLQYANTGIPVCFAQCWVFAGVFNTFLRCLGIPTRVITNFCSAHDNTGNLKTDLIFKSDGTPDRRHTLDSVWNYHCWNEVCMLRPDLPPELSGWQVVDATPQETSDGHFRCGPASVKAIKEGLVCYPFDSGFVFAEVNSDIVFMKRDRYGNLSPFRVDKTYVGQALYTQSIGSDAPFDITNEYKYPEGSAQDNDTMRRAEQYGCEREHSEPPPTKLTITIQSEQVQLGQDINLLVDLQNHDLPSRDVHVHLSSSVIFYTGVRATRLKEENFMVTVPSYQTERLILKMSAAEYLPHLGSQRALEFVVTGQADDQSVSAVKVVTLQSTSLTLTVSGRPQVNQEMFVTLSFTNPLNFPLQNITVAMEGPGLMSYKTHHYSVIEPLAIITWTEVFLPRLPGPRRISGVLECKQLGEVLGSVDINVEV